MSDLGTTDDLGIVWGAVYAPIYGNDFDSLVSKKKSTAAVRGVFPSSLDYNDSGNDQKYGIFIPFFDGHDYYFVDTHVLGLGEPFFLRTKKDNITEIQRYADGLASLKDPDVGKGVWSLISDYFYKNYFVLDKDSIKCFRLICDLHDCEIISSSDETMYKKEDIFMGIKLYNEHYYPSGMMLHKKGGEIDWARKIMDHCLNSMQLDPPEVNQWDKDDLDSFIAKSHGDYDKELVARTIAIYDFLAKQREEYDSFITELKNKKERSVDYATKI
jgi:hypothetical protein